MEIIEHHRRHARTADARGPGWLERALLHPSTPMWLAVAAAGVAARAQPLTALHLTQLGLSLSLCALLRYAARQRRALEGLAQRRGTEAEARTLWLDAVSGLSPDGVLVFELDAEQGHRLVFTNPAFSQLFGLRPEELLGLSEAATDEWLAGLAPVDGAMPPLSPGEVNLTLAGPPSRVLRRRSREDERQRVYYFRDVTHETAVERLKNEFLTTAAHELRTPLAVVYGYSELLLEPAMVADAAKRIQLCEVIHRQASLLTHLVNELLTLAQIDAQGSTKFSCVPCPWQGAIRHGLTQLESDELRQRVQVELAPEDGWVLAEPSKLNMVLDHVLSNALKYSGTAPVVIELKQTERDGTPWCVLLVRDQGIGMDAEQCERAFERFYRVDQSGHRLGAGLGLPIVSELMRLMDGEVHLSSQPGVGSVVSLSLRAAPGTRLPTGTGRQAELTS